jgi:hypothetical protein
MAQHTNDKVYNARERVASVGVTVLAAYDGRDHPTKSSEHGQ